jgi:GTPase involved in cell partitioning and DNA repair
MSDASSMTRYSAEAFGAVCEEVRYLKTVVESQNTYIETLKADSGRKETEENLTAQLRDAWKECDQARAKVEKLERACEAALSQYHALHENRRITREHLTLEHAKLTGDCPDTICTQLREALAAYKKVNP